MPFLTNDPLPQCLQQSSAMGASTLGGHERDVSAISLKLSVSLAFAAPRIFKDDTAEDTRAIQPVLGQIMFYPLSRFDGKMKTKDWSKIPHFPVPSTSEKGETKWVVPE